MNTHLRNFTTSVLRGIFFVGFEIIFLGNTNESLCWVLHLNHFLCYLVSLRSQSLDHFLIYVNNFPKSIVTMFTDDTKCHRALQHPNDKILQSDCIEKPTTNDVNSFAVMLSRPVALLVLKVLSSQKMKDSSTSLNSKLYGRSMGG